MRCPRCGGKVIRDDDVLTRQPEHSCIACGWNDSRPVMSAGEDSLIREAGVTESELGLDLLEEVATRTFGNRVTTWLWTYHIRVGFK